MARDNIAEGASLDPPVALGGPEEGAMPNQWQEIPSIRMGHLPEDVVDAELCNVVDAELCTALVGPLLQLAVRAAPDLCPLVYGGPGTRRRPTFNLDGRVVGGGGARLTTTPGQSKDTAQASATKRGNRASSVFGGREDRLLSGAS